MVLFIADILNLFVISFAVFLAFCFSYYQTTYFLFASLQPPLYQDLVCIFYVPKRNRESAKIKKYSKLNRVQLFSAFWVTTFSTPGNFWVKRWLWEQVKTVLPIFYSQEKFLHSTVTQNEVWNTVDLSFLEHLSASEIFWGCQ